MEDRGPKQKQSAVDPRSSTLDPRSSLYRVLIGLLLFIGVELWFLVMHGIAIQAGWVIAAYALARFAWRRGIRRYSAVGG